MTYSHVKTSMRRTAAILATTFAMASAASPAAAASPQSFSFHDVGGGSIDCSQFNSAWTFTDDFEDVFDGQGRTFLDAKGNEVRTVLHIVHRSNDVNSVTGFAINEHDNLTVTLFPDGTTILSGAINIAQRRGLGSVIHNTGHKVIGPDGQPLLLAGPNRADDADFCRAVAP